MKIAFLLNSRVPSADAHVLQSIRMCEAFAANGHDVILHYPNRRQTNPDFKNVDIDTYFDIDTSFEKRSHPYLDANAVRTILGFDTDTQSVFSRACFTMQLALKMRRSDADIYYTRGAFQTGLLVALGLPTVFETHRMSYSNTAERFIRWIADSSHLRAVVTLTHATAESLQDLGVPEERIAVVPDGVKLDAYDDPLSKVAARQLLDLPQDSYIVGYTGSLDRGKGVHDLIRAVADLDVMVLVVGGRHERSRETFRDFLADNGIENVRYVGHVSPDCVPNYQWASDILVLPARQDIQTESHHPRSTSPLKLFEYMAAGRPIVATRLPGIEDVLTYGETARLVPPDDVAALREAITDLREDDSATELGTKARRSVGQYTWGTRAGRVLDHVF